jgi:hypothetical protein
MLNIEEVYKQLDNEMGMNVNPGYTIFKAERQGDAIVIIPGCPAMRDAVMGCIKRAIEADPEMIKPIIRQVLSEAF